MLLSDGITEASPTAHDLFGKDRLTNVVCEHQHKSAEELVTEITDACRKHLRGHPQQDDMTIIVIKKLA